MSKKILSLSIIVLLLMAAWLLVRYGNSTCPRLRITNKSDSNIKKLILTYNDGNIIQNNIPSNIDLEYYLCLNHDHLYGATYSLEITLDNNNVLTGGDFFQENDNIKVVLEPNSIKSYK